MYNIYLTCIYIYIPVHYGDWEGWWFEQSVL